MSRPHAHLIKMANQIVASVPGNTPVAKAENALAHIEKFWSPLMKQQIRACVAKDEQVLDRALVELLQR